MEKQRLLQLIEGIAAQLGEGWRVKPVDEDSNRYGRELINDAHPGFGLFIRTHWSDDKKLMISGDYPRGPQNESYYSRWIKGEKVDAPSIGVSAARPVADIVRDINRRFLPQAIEWLAYANACNAEEVARKAARQGLAEQIAKASGGKVSGNDGRNGDTHVVDDSYSAGQADFTFDISYKGDYVSKIEIRSIDTASALAIAAILKTAKRE